MQTLLINARYKSNDSVCKKDGTTVLNFRTERSYKSLKWRSFSRSLHQKFLKFLHFPPAHSDKSFLAHVRVRDLKMNISFPLDFSLN